MNNYAVKTSKILLCLFIILSFANAPTNALGLDIISGTGKLYLNLTNPIEYITSARTIVEQQHYVPSSFGMKEFNDIVFLTRINHTVSDRWKSKPFLSDAHYNILTFLLTLTNRDSVISLDAAYRLGAYVSPYSIFRYKYNGSKVSLLCTQLDAPSMLVYGFAWIINTPQKLVNKIAYIINKNSAPSIFCLIDIIPNMLTLAFIELPLAIIGTTAGTVIAFIFNPFDSICSIFGMFYFLIMAVITAGWDLALGFIRLLPFI